MRRPFREPIGRRRTASAVGLTVLVVASVAVTGFAGCLSPSGPGRTPRSAGTTERTSHTARTTSPTRPPGRTTYRSIVVFRDDDVQAHYRTRAFEAVSTVFVEEEVPVTYGVIPYSGPTPITEGPRICGDLTALHDRHGRLVEFAVHGYAHRPRTDFSGGSEFGGVPATEQRSMIEEGRSVVRSCTGETPRTFVPPYNTYDHTTTAALADAGFTTVSGGPAFTNRYYGRTGPFQARGLVHVPDSAGFVANWSTHEFHDARTLRSAFDETYAEGGVYVQMLHHPTFTTGPDESTVSTRKLDRLRSFVRYVKGHDVKFMTLGAFGEAYASGRLRRTSDGWVFVGRRSPAPGRPPSSLPGPAVRGRRLHAKAKAG